MRRSQTRHYSSSTLPARAEGTALSGAASSAAAGRRTTYRSRPPSPPLRCLMFARDTHCLTTRTREASPCAGGLPRPHAHGSACLPASYVSTQAWSARMAYWRSPDSADASRFSSCATVPVRGSDNVYRAPCQNERPSGPQQVQQLESPTSLVAVLRVRQQYVCMWPAARLLAACALVARPCAYASGGANTSDLGAHAPGNGAAEEVTPAADALATAAKAHLVLMSDRVDALSATIRSSFASKARGSA